MLFTVVGDTHITHKSYDRALDLFSLVEEIGKPTIWLGDMLDTKEVIRGKCLNLLLDYFSKSKVHHYVIVGNHDWFNLDCSAHALEALKLLSNVVVVDRPMMVEPGLVFFPYMHDRAALEQAISSFQDPVLTLFAHLDVEKFDFGNGHVSTSGIPASALSGFRAVISGHFHKYQKDGNLTYLGTPMSKDFGEANQTKYVGLFDTETAELKIAETEFPKHVSIEFNCDAEDRGEVDQVLRELRAQDFNRIVLSGKQVHIDKFPKELFSQLNVKWVSRPSDHMDNSVSIEETASNEKQFVKWASDIKKMDQKTLELGLSILEACR